MSFYQAILLGVLLAQLCAQTARVWVAWRAYKAKQAVARDYDMRPIQLIVQEFVPARRLKDEVKSVNILRSEK